MEGLLKESPLCFACAEVVSASATQCPTCGTHFNPPPVDPAPSRWLRVAGVTHLLLGSLGVLCALFAIASMPSAASSLSMWGTTLGALAAFALLATAGVGLLRLRPWGRGLAIAWSVLAIGWTGAWWVELMTGQGWALLQSDFVTGTKAVLWSLMGGYALVVLLGVIRAQTSGVERAVQPTE